MTSNLIHNTIDDVFLEVKHLLSLMYPEQRFDLFDKAFDDIISLFEGNYDGYKQCNTPFHDLQHTLDCLLAMIRLLHGAYIGDIRFSREEIELGLVAALMHDTGYIQTIDDTEGSGAKYTLIHVRRSAEFLQRYFEKKAYADSAAAFCIHCINYTGLGSEIEKILLNGGTPDLIGQMLGTADLVGQMADHSYLEKLFYLAEEFKEGKVPGYENEDILLKKTKEFYSLSRERLKNEYGSVVKYLKNHFEQRWGINRNVYLDSIQKQINYLDDILKKYPFGYKSYLKRRVVPDFFQIKKQEKPID